MENEKSKYQTLINVYSNIKDNLSMITVIPLLLGGMWQILQLSIISVSYIRFFSVTQLVADGLLIALIVCMILLSSVLAHRMDSFRFVTNYEDINNKTNQQLITHILITTFATAGITYYVYYDAFSYKFPTDSFDLLAFIFGIFILLIFLKNLRSVIIIIVVIFERSTGFSIYNKHNEVVNGLPNYLLTLYFITHLPIFFYQLGLFNRTLISNNSNNIKQITNEFKKRFPKEKIGVIYFNDKYIFIGNIDNNKNITIVPFENLIKQTELNMNTKLPDNGSSN